MFSKGKYNNEYAAKKKLIAKQFLDVLYIQKQYNSSVQSIRKKIIQFICNRPIIILTLLATSLEPK